MLFMVHDANDSILVTCGMTGQFMWKLETGFLFVLFFSILCFRIVHNNIIYNLYLPVISSLRIFE